MPVLWIIDSSNNPSILYGQLMYNLSFFLLEIVSENYSELFSVTSGSYTYCFYMKLVNLTLSWYVKPSNADGREISYQMNHQRKYTWIVI